MQRTAELLKERAHSISVHFLVNVGHVNSAGAALHLRHAVQMHAITMWGQRLCLDSQPDKRLMLPSWLRRENCLSLFQQLLIGNKVIAYWSARLLHIAHC
jgi:hypothetical protein